MSLSNHSRPCEFCRPHKETEHFQFFITIRTKSNEVRYLLVNATTRRNDVNAIIGVVGVAQDVTEAAKHDRAVAAVSFKCEK